MKFLLSLYFLFSIASLSYTQDVKKVVQVGKNSQISEEYFVLKSDKSIKHGNYVKYLIRLAVEKYFQEFGSYDHNTKSGVWFYFNPIHPRNPISIIGEFNGGQRTGQWVYFYPTEIKDTSVFYLLGYKKSTNIISSKKELQITIDTTGLKLAAIGNFEKNKKVGRWNYYSREGELIKIFDFSIKREIYSLKNDSINLYLLGGFSHFQVQLTQSLFENAYELESFPSSNASFEIITNDGNLYVNNLTPLTDNPLAFYIEKAVKNMPLYWIDFDPILENFSFTINLKFNQKEEGSNFDFESINPKFNK